MVHDSKLEKSNKQLRLRSGHGRNVSVVREVYRREDVPCQSQLCLSDCQNATGDGGMGLLPADINHYLVPDCRVAREFLEVLENPVVTGIIFLQTVVHSVQHEGSRRLYNRLRNLVKDKRKASIIFHNEFQKYAYCERDQGETLADWQTRSTYTAAEWFYHHLAGQKPIIMVTLNKKAIEAYGNKTQNVFVLSLEDYLRKFWQSHIPEVMELYESLTASLETKVKGKDYKGYLPMDILEAGVKSGRFVQGHINVNRSNAGLEAFVKQKRSSKIDDADRDILIHGMSCRNRAVHGDLVVVEMLPRSEWKGRSSVIKENQEGQVEEAEEDGVSDGNVMPTGRVVGISQRNWREYVASFASDEKVSEKGGKVLVIPWDYRIPKIRISTRQVEKLKDQRIVVRIDSWEIDSQYPNGHFVKSLGAIGDLEAEISAILLENTIHASEFSEAQMKELPVDTPENPWCIEDTELSKRRDLRSSHLIFSIDPKGCEDVDDTLSVRYLDNGNLELGVHIADVTHFVRPGSLTDMEAQSRSTTVYLADRRYDMLPGILSANLCSLISGVDRYAMSVIWELDKDFEVVNVWYGKTIIRSSYKLFYEMAQAMHDGIAMSEIIENVPELQNLSKKEMKNRVDELRSAVVLLMKIARRLKARRVCGGALELESVEVQVQLTETKSIENLTPKDHLEIHDTIAECMIFANHWVAKKIAEVFPNQTLLRHHPLPKNEQFENLKNCAKNKGFEVKTSSNKDLADTLDVCVDPNDPIVNRILRMLATQAMSVASYFSTGSLSRDQFFHYGLALDYYTHFTSPIRRYADVLVHRQLMAAVQGQGSELLPGNQELDMLSEHINHQHRAAQNAQRDSQELFQYLYFKQKDADDVCCVADAIIFQLRANGLMVFVPRYGIRGPVYLRNKDGQVIFVMNTGHSEWTNGNITKSEGSISINSVLGTQTFHLLDHITVKITLHSSRAHASSLRLELISNEGYELDQKLSAADKSSKSQKQAIIQEVTAIAEEKRNQSSTEETSSRFQSLKEEFGQTPESVSLYTLFQSFKEQAVTPVAQQ
ncbi:DIS3-like exonuclease 1 [Ostrea edulis]|uniref:DIS3-like exonuclease 1 n=1 Tax=Ostrea edulis TaxID=37623 RepID=UPI0024AEA4BB|nr:DIS3-like exonuclease 1 [Ostrea edulis]